jgi:hypothetical protein
MGRHVETWGQIPRKGAHDAKVHTSLVDKVAYSHHVLYNAFKRPSKSYKGRADSIWASYPLSPAAAC